MWVREVASFGRGGLLRLTLRHGRENIRQAGSTHLTPRSLFPSGDRIKISRKSAVVVSHRHGPAMSERNCCAGTVARSERTRSVGAVARFATGRFAGRRLRVHLWYSLQLAGRADCGGCMTDVLRRWTLSLHLVRKGSRRLLHLLLVTSKRLFCSQGGVTHLFLSCRRRGYADARARIALLIKCRTRDSG